MSISEDDSVPIIDRILHPSDFSTASELAFVHALKVALITKSQLTVMHVSPSMTAEWTDFPGVRETLTRHLRQDKLYIKENEGILHEVKNSPCCQQEKRPCSCP